MNSTDDGEYPKIKQTYVVLFLPLFNMENIFIKLLPQSVNYKYYNIKKRTKEHHKTASTSGFIKNNT